MGNSDISEADVKRMEAEKDVEGLIRVLKAENWKVRCAAAKALGKVGDKRAVEPLMQALKDKWSNVQDAAEKALEEIGEPAVKPLIQEIIEDRIHARHRIVKILNNIGKAGVVEYTPEPFLKVLDYLDSSASEVIKTVFDILQNIGKPAVEPIIRVLNSKNKLVRLGAIRVLGKLGDERAVEPLIEILNLRNNYSSIQEDVTLALAKIGGERAVEVLLQTLMDKNPVTRKYATTALGLMGDTRAVEPLIQALKCESEYDYVRRAVINALGEIGDVRAVEPVVRALLSDKDEFVRVNAARALGILGDERALEPLIQALRDIARGVRMKAALALGNLKDVRAVKPLIKALKVECLLMQRAPEYFTYSFYPKEVVEALGKLGEAAVEPLIQMLEDKDINVRRGAEEALEIIGWQPKNNIERVHQLIGKQEWDKVAEVGEPAVEPLIQALKDKKVFVRWNAAQALGKIGDSKAIEPLMQALKDESFSVREKAAVAFGKIGEPVVEFLIPALSNEDWHVRWGAAMALGGIKDKRVVEPLEKALKDQNGEVRMTAAMSLGKIIEERAVKSLEQALRDNIGMNASERLSLIEKIIENYANGHMEEPYVGGDFYEDFQKFNPIEYEIIMQKISDYPNMSLWDYKSPGDLFDDAMKELFYYMQNAEREVRTSAMLVFWSAQSKGGYIESRYSNAWSVKYEVNSEKYWKFFVDALGEEDPRIRSYAVGAVKRFDMDVKFPDLIDFLDSENPHLRQGAREAIADAIWDAYLDEFTPFDWFLKNLIKAAGQKDDNVRKEIAFEIEGIEEQYFSGVFVEELRNSPNEWIREFSAKMLRRQWIEKEEEYNRVVNALIEALKDPSPRVRRMVVETMGDFYEKLDLEDLPEPEEILYIDALIAALGDEDQNVREEVLKALGKLGVKQSSIGKLTEALIALMERETGREVKPLERFLKMLDSDKYYIRRLAILCLGYLGEKAVVEKLKSFLKDEDCIFREAAVLALGFYTSEQVGETLESALNDPAASVRRATVKSLHKVEGSKAVETLIRSLDDENYWVRMRAIEALGEIRSEAAVRGLLKALKDRDYNIRQTASKHLIDINDFYVIEGLIETLKDQSYEARKQAAIVLGYIGDERAVKPLVNLIGDNEKMVANAALSSLLQINIRIPEGFKQAISDIDDDSIFESLTMHSARTTKSGFILLGIPSMDIVLLCELLDDPRVLPALLHQYDAHKRADPVLEDKVRWEAGKIIDKLKGNVSIETLLELLKKSYGAKAKGKIISMLGEKRDPQIIKPIFYKLGDGDETIRDSAKQALMNFKSQISNILIEALDSPNPYLRESAIDMLGKMGDRRVIKAAFEALNDNKNKNIRDKGIETLGRLREGSAVEYLLNALKQGDAKAAEALRNIGRKKILENAPENIDGTPPLTYIKNLAENPSITEIQGNSKVTKYFSNDFKKEIEKLVREIENKQPFEP